MEPGISAEKVNRPKASRLKGGSDTEGVSGVGRLSIGPSTAGITTSSCIYLTRCYVRRHI